MDKNAQEMTKFGDYLGFLIKSRYVIDMSRFSDEDLATLGIERRTISGSEELSQCQLHVMRAEEIYKNWPIVREKFVELSKHHLGELTSWKASSIESWVGSMGASYPSQQASDVLKQLLRLSDQETEFYNRRFTESHRASELFRDSLKCPKFILALIGKADLPTGPKQGSRPPIKAAAERCGQVAAYKIERTTLSTLTNGYNTPTEGNIMRIVHGLGFGGKTLSDVFGNQAANMTDDPSVTVEAYFLQLMHEDDKKRGRVQKEKPTPIAQALDILFEEKNLARVEVLNLCKGEITVSQLSNWFGGTGSPDTDQIRIITTALKAPEKIDELSRAAAATRTIIKSREKVPEGAQAQTTGILRRLMAYYELSYEDLGLARVTLVQRLSGRTDNTIELASIFLISSSEKIPIDVEERRALEQTLFLARHQDVLLWDADRKPWLDVPWGSFADVGDAAAKPRFMASAERSTSSSAQRNK